MLTFYEFLEYIVPNNYFNTQRLMFTFQGLWTPENRYFQMIYMLCVIPHTLMATIWLITSEIIMIVKLSETDAKQTMLTLSVTIIHVLGAFRIIHWNFILKKKLGPLIKILNRNIDFNIFNLNDVKLDKLVDKRQKSNRYEDVRLRWRYIGRCFVENKYKYIVRNEIDEFQRKEELYTRFVCFYVQSGYYLGLALFLLSAYVRKFNVYWEYNPRVNGISKYIKLPFETYFPFDTSVSDGYPNLAIVYQLYMYISNVGAFLSIDNFGFNLINLMTSKVKILNFAITQIDENIKVSGKSALLIKEMRLIKCLDELKPILKANEMFEEQFNTVLLIQNILSSLTMCTNLYILQLVTSAREFGYVGYMGILVLFEPFILCWNCQTLTEEFNKLLGALFHLDWLHYPPYLRRKIYFAMTVFTKPKILTLGGLTTINLEFYISWLKNTYSAYTLISSTQN